MLKNINSAFELDLLIRQLKNRAEGLSLDMGAALYEMESKKQYIELGYPTFESYLGNPEVSMGRSTAYRLMANYKTYVLTLGVSPVGLLPSIGEAKLELIRPYVTSENKEELLAMGTSLSKSDLKIELAERFNGGVELKPYISWEEICDELYRDLFSLDTTCQLPGCRKYQNAKRALKRDGWE